MGACCISRERENIVPCREQFGKYFTPRSSGGDDDGAGSLNKHAGLRAFCPERVHGKINERYEFNKSDSIGSGQFGTVFLAKDKRYNQRIVAIKKIWTSSSTQQMREEFSRERSVMQELDHPNICKLLETWDEGRFMYFVMEYCAGKEIFLRITDSGAIHEKASCDIVKQVASALNHAHGRGIAHRDIKAENVVFCTDDDECRDIKVIDWGIAFFFQEAKMRSTVGSTLYIAPEVLDPASVHKGYTCACDAFSLGVLTYIMLSGRMPFWGNIGKQLGAKQKEEYPMKGETWNTVSDEAKDLIRSLLKSNPQERLTMDAVMEHPWLNGGAQTTEVVVSKEVLHNLNNFCNTSRLKASKRTADFPRSRRLDRVRRNDPPRRVRTIPARVSSDANPTHVPRGLSARTE